MRERDYETLRTTSRTSQLEKAKTLAHDPRKRTARVCPNTNLLVETWGSTDPRGRSRSKEQQVGKTSGKRVGDEEKDPG